MNTQIVEEEQVDRRELRMRLAYDLHAEIKAYADRAGVPLSSFAAGLLALGLGRWESELRAARERVENPPVTIRPMDPEVRAELQAKVDAMKGDDGYGAITYEKDSRIAEAMKEAHAPVVRDVKENYEKAVKALDEVQARTQTNHVHRPGEALGEEWVAGTRYVQYACADKDCNVAMTRRH